MIKNKLGRFGVLFLALFFLLGGIPINTVTAAAPWLDITETIPDGANVIATQNGTTSYELWHYSGGYWAKNTSDPLRITDSQLQGDLDNLADTINETIQFEYAVPEAVTAALKAGKKVGVCVAAPAGFGYFNVSRGLPRVRIENGALYLQAYPKFNFVTAYGYTYNDFVGGLNKNIPFVNPKYGQNCYAMYTTGGALLGTARGHFNPNDPTELGREGTIHPSQISDSGGSLKSGFTVSVSGKSYNSSAVKIGVGTFQNAGAVGFIFDYSLTITYYEIDDADVANNDVAVTKIEKTSYPATSVVTADVTVKNLGFTPITTPVEFSIPGLTTQSKDVTLAADQSTVLHFTFSTPPSGTLTMTAEANKERTFEETDYTNNKLTVTARIIPIPSGSASCSDTITWTETGYHMVYFNWFSYPCYHTFTYETKLTAEHDILPKTLKSGYGFAVTVNNSVSTRLVGNQGCGAWGAGRANTLIPTLPDKAQVKLGWGTSNRLGTQPSTVDLNLVYRTATQSRFECGPNLISEIKAKLIYTDVALAGTRQSPKQHQILINITGGGVNGIPFCKEITDRITINGNMYEDDATGAN